MNIHKQQASREIGQLADMLHDRNVGMLDFQDPNVSCDAGIGGLIYSSELFEIFSSNPSFFLGNAFDDSCSFESVDKFVWYTIEKHAEDILCHWAFWEYIKFDGNLDLWDDAENVKDEDDEEDFGNEEEQE